MQLSEHFSLEEMTRSQMAARLEIENVPDETSVKNLTILCQEVLEPIRSHFGIPFSPSSGYRSAALSEGIGSSGKSQHCKGEAADIEVPTISNLTLCWWIRSHLAFDQLILEFFTEGDPASGWVHVSKKDRSGGSKNRHQVLTYDGEEYSGGLPG
jgi:hypothetical protein